MNLGDFGRLVRRNAKEHSPIILSVTAGFGTLVTAYLAGSASFKAAKLIITEEEIGGMHADPKERLKERVKLVWTFYIPAAASATTTILCIIGANRVATNKTLAATTAFTVAERAFADYREKIIEEYGERKDQSIRDKIAEERIKNDPPGEVIVMGSGHVLCREDYTGRYFNSDMEALRKAQNVINHKINAHDYATLNDFYYEIGLQYTQASSNLGWTSGRLMELEISSAVTPKGEPCLTFGYNYIKPL